MGCPNLIMVTDHKPLKESFDDSGLSKIQNLQLFKLKEKSLKVQVYHPALLWEVAQSLWCSLPQTSNHFASAPKHTSCRTFSVRHQSNDKNDWVKSSTLLAMFGMNDDIALTSVQLDMATHNTPNKRDFQSCAVSQYPRSANTGKWGSASTLTTA